MRGMRQRVAAMVVVLAVTAAVMWPVCGHDFVEWDDTHNFKRNMNLARPAGEALKEFWTKPHWDLWVPVTYTAWRVVAADARRSDGTYDPRPFHTLNFLAHLAAAAGAFALVRGIVRNDWAACAGALVFAVHPVQVEAVAWASGTKDVLAGMFGAWALAAHVA